MSAALTEAAAGLGLGIALAGAPGPVQAVLLNEAIRGGVGRGFRAMVGANGIFAMLLVLLALGVSVAEPTGVVLRVLEIVGGGFLAWLAVDGFRSAAEPIDAPEPRRRLTPVARGVLAVVLNPGAWLFLATGAASLLGAATRSGGKVGALVAAVGLLIGVSLGDTAAVLLGGLGLRRARSSVVTWVRRILAVVLAALGLWLIVTGVRGH